MSKIVPLQNWDAYAALSAALADSLPEDGVLILVEKENGKFTRYAANIKNTQVVYLCEMVKHELFEKVTNKQ